MSTESEELAELRKENQLKEEENYSNPSNRQEKENNTEYQKWSADVEKFKFAFLQRFAGAYIYQKPIKKKFLGETKTVYVDEIRYDAKNRSMNKYGAGFLFDNVYPLISHIVSSSNLSEKFIRRQWRGHIGTIIFGLADAYEDSNKYEMTEYEYLNIVSYLITYSSFTMKAKDGFTFKQATEFIQSATITRIGGETPIHHERRGIGQRVNDLIRGR